MAYIKQVFKNPNQEVLGEHYSSKLCADVYYDSGVLYKETYYFPWDDQLISIFKECAEKGGDLNKIVQNVINADNNGTPEDHEKVMPNKFYIESEYYSYTDQYGFYHSDENWIVTWGGHYGEDGVIESANIQREKSAQIVYDAYVWQLEKFKELYEKSKPKYFSQKDLKESLGEEGMQQLNAVTIDPGKNFMDGKSTNVTTDSNNELGKPDNYVENGENEAYDNYIDYAKTVAAEQVGENGEDESYNNYIKYVKNQASETQHTSTEKSPTEIAELERQAAELNTSDENVFTLSLKKSKLAESKELVKQGINAAKQITGQAANVMAGGAAAYGMTRGIIDNAANLPQIITTLSMSLVSKATEVITNEVAKLTTDYLQKHAQAIMLFPTQISSYSMAYFNANKMSIADALKAMTQSNEDRQEKSNEENNKKSKTEFINNIQEKSQEFIGTVNDYVKTGTSYISMVTAYIQNGPEWVSNQLDKQIGKLVEGAKEQIDKRWEKDKEQYDIKAKAIGDKIGEEMAAKYNNAIKETQKASQEKIKKAKAKVTIQLFTVKAKAASQLGSLLGIYIPV